MNLKTGLMRLWIATSTVWAVTMVGLGLYAWWVAPDPWRVVAVESTRHDFVGAVLAFWSMVEFSGKSVWTFLPPYLALAVVVPLAALAIGALGAWVIKGFRGQVPAAS